MRHFATLALGLITAIGAAVLTVLLQMKYHTNFIGFYAWFVVPLGAIGIGILCTSGFLVGTRLFHVPMTRSLVIQVILVSIVSYLLIYVLDYLLFNDNGIYIKDQMSFIEYYISISTSGSYSIKNKDIFQLGRWGYAFSAIEFIGFILSGILCLGMLPTSPYCSECKRYMKKEKSFVKQFATPESAFEYLENYFDLDIQNEAFIELLSSDGDVAVKKKPDTDTIQIEHVMYQCKDCQAQSIGNTVKYYNGKEWEEQPEYSIMLESPTPIYYEYASALAK